MVTWENLLNFCVCVIMDLCDVTCTIWHYYDGHPHSTCDAIAVVIHMKHVAPLSMQSGHGIDGEDTIIISRVVFIV